MPPKGRATLLLRVEQGCVIVAAPGVVDNMPKNIPRFIVILLLETSER
jgi:hypothetical protein